MPIMADYLCQPRIQKQIQEILSCIQQGMVSEET